MLASDRQTAPIPITLKFSQNLSHILHLKIIANFYKGIIIKMHLHCKCRLCSALTTCKVIVHFKDLPSKCTMESIWSIHPFILPSVIICEAIFSALNENKQIKKTVVTNRGKIFDLELASKVKVTAWYHWRVNALLSILQKQETLKTKWQDCKTNS